MKILILGNGFIAQKIYKGLKDLHEVNIYEGFISGRKEVIRGILLYHPEIIINCIGKTGTPNIDWCEDHKEETMLANVTVPLLIADVCWEAGIKMIHISSGCIYEGGIFWEEDPPNFIKSYYSRTKWMAEQALKDFDILQLRLRMPIDYIGSHRNLINKIFSYKKLINVRNSVTVLDDFIYALEQLIKCEAKGIFNVVNPEPVTHKDLIEIFEPVMGKWEGEFIAQEDLVTKAGRSNCVLSVTKLGQHGIHLRKTADALQDCVNRYVKPVEATEPLPMEDERQPPNEDRPVPSICP